VSGTLEVEGGAVPSPEHLLLRIDGPPLDPGDARPLFALSGRR
jgi:hypothetical protein